MLAYVCFNVGTVSYTVASAIHLLFVTHSQFIIQLLKKIGQNENRTNRRSASKITDVRNPPILFVKDQHCFQTTRVICYINRLAINDA